jgi:hypothetical protein
VDNAFTWRLISGALGLPTQGSIITSAIECQGTSASSLYRVRSLVLPVLPWL